MTLQLQRPEHPVARFSQATTGATDRTLQPPIAIPRGRGSGIRQNLGEPKPSPPSSMAASCASRRRSYVLLDLRLIAPVAGLVEHAAPAGRRADTAAPPSDPGKRADTGSLRRAQSPLVAVAIRRWRAHRLLLLLHRRQRVEEGQRRIALGRGCQVERRLGQMEAPFGQADALEGLRRTPSPRPCACGSASPTSSPAKISMRRKMKRGSSPAYTMRAIQ